MFPKKKKNSNALRPNMCCWPGLAALSKINSTDWRLHPEKNDRRQAQHCDKAIFGAATRRGYKLAVLKW